MGTEVLTSEARLAHAVRRRRSPLAQQAPRHMRPKAIESLDVESDAGQANRLRIAELVPARAKARVTFQRDDGSRQVFRIVGYDADPEWIDLLILTRLSGSDR